MLDTVLLFQLFEALMTVHLNQVAFGDLLLEEVAKVVGWLLEVRIHFGSIGSWVSTDAVNCWWSADGAVSLRTVLLRVRFGRALSPLRGLWFGEPLLRVVQRAVHFVA